MGTTERFLRGCVAIMYGILHILIFTTSGFLFAFVVAAIVSGGDGVIFRHHITRHTTWHGACLIRILRALLGINITITRLNDAFIDPKIAYIIISNHQSVMDIPVLCYVLWSLRLFRLRWILKHELWWTPFGWAAFLTKCGLVKRRKERGKEDVTSVASCGKSAMEDGASVIIFPEGTRFRGVKPGEYFRYVLRPKLGGFQTLREQMPQAPILSLTLCWHGGKMGMGFGRTMWDTFDLVGRNLHITVQTIPRAEVDADWEWLNLHWEEKDIQLAIVQSPCRVKS